MRLHLTGLAMSIQLVLFWNDDTAIVLDAQHTIESYKPAFEDWL